MMKALTILLSLVSMNCFAVDTITGTVLLSGKTLPVSVDTNINTGKAIKLDQTIYKIDRINSENIEASRGAISIEVYLGSTFDAILNMSASELATRLGLKNTNEIRCGKARSKGFLVYRNQSLALGNCIQ